MIFNEQLETQNWSDIGFAVETTADSSPTLRILGGTTESMHHSGGALEETELIYASLIKEKISELKDTKSNLDFIVVGLGLGYIEMIIARESINFGISPERIHVFSYELVPELKHFFSAWYSDKPLHEEVYEVYHKIESMLNPHRLPIQKVLKLWDQTKNITLLPALDEKTMKLSKADCVLFDAFSAKTTPSLWTEDFLVEFLDSVAKPNCTLSTYASRSSLKNALKRANFDFQTLEGFKGKRNSTRARKL